MEFRKFADTYVVRLDKGEEIIASLQALCEKEKIALAGVEGIGAADHAVIGLYDVGQRQYTCYDADGCRSGRERKGPKVESREQLG